MATVRCPECGGPAEFVSGESAYCAIDVLPDLLRVCDAWYRGKGQTVYALGAIEDALAKLGLTTTESIEAAIRAQEAK